MGILSKSNNREQNHEVPYDIDALRQILVDTVMIPALTKKQLALGDFPSDRFKRKILAECESVVKSLDMEQRFNVTFDALVDSLGLEACYQDALCETVQFELSQLFKREMEVNPVLFLDISDIHQERLNLQLKAAQWLYKAHGLNAPISSTEAFNQVSALFDKAQREHMDRSTH